MVLSSYLLSVVLLCDSMTFSQCPLPPCNDRSFNILHTIGLHRATNRESETEPDRCLSYHVQLEIGNPETVFGQGAFLVVFLRAELGDPGRDGAGAPALREGVYADEVPPLHGRVRAHQQSFTFWGYGLRRTGGGPPKAYWGSSSFQRLGRRNERSKTLFVEVPFDGGRLRGAVQYVL